MDFLVFSVIPELVLMYIELSVLLLWQNLTMTVL